MRPQVAVRRDPAAVADQYGITRLAQYTGLDRIGVPVWGAVRPAATTLSVSQGKGLSDETARWAAVAEAVELWSVEGHRADRSGLVTGVFTRESSRINPDRLYILRRPGHYGWQQPHAASTSRTDGMGCHIDPTLALDHAAWEAVERHMLSQAGEDLRQVTPVGSVAGTSQLAQAVDTFRHYGGEVAVGRVRVSLAGIPLFVSRVELRSSDYPRGAVGFGCADSTEAAAGRALLEAIQTRLTGIVGAREDVDAPADFGSQAVVDWRPREAPESAMLTATVRRHAPGLALLKRVWEHTGQEPRFHRYAQPDGSPMHCVRVVTGPVEVTVDD